MILQFRVGNYRSFKDIATFSMVASSIKERESENVFCYDDKLELLKSAIIYGANASGKSNLLKAMNFMKSIVLNSSKESLSTEEINVRSFKLSTETENQPSFFEMVFIHKKVKYRYGFQVDRKKVHSEWLFYSPKGRETRLFTREDNNCHLGLSFKEGKDLIKKTRENALFVSVVAQFNGNISKNVLDWFANLKHISGGNESKQLDYTINKLKVPGFKEKILRFLKIADFDIEDIDSLDTKIDKNNLPKNMPDEIKKAIIESAKEVTSRKIYTSHNKYNKENNPIEYVKFDLEFDESKGTKKFLSVSGPIIDVLSNGSVFTVDELDARLHPKLVQYIIGLFNSKDNNPLNAQLIFVSHNTNYLNSNLFRRDQIWFTDKNDYGVTDLYSLVEYKKDNKKVRNDASYEKNYLLGKYGSTPNIFQSESIIRDKDEK